MSATCATCPCPPRGARSRLDRRRNLRFVHCNAPRRETIEVCAPFCLRRSIIRRHSLPTPSTLSRAPHSRLLPNIQKRGNVMQNISSVACGDPNPNPNPIPDPNPKCVKSATPRPESQLRTHTHAWLHNAQGPYKMQYKTRSMTTAPNNPNLFQ